MTYTRRTAPALTPQERAAAEVQAVLDEADELVPLLIARHGDTPQVQAARRAALDKAGRRVTTYRPGTRLTLTLQSGNQPPRPRTLHVEVISSDDTHTRVQDDQGRKMTLRNEALTRLASPVLDPTPPGPPIDGVQPTFDLGGAA